MGSLNDRNRTIFMKMVVDRESQSPKPHFFMKMVVDKDSQSPKLHYFYENGR
jgi:hypothetical protein